jgi:hypothetical protein
MPQHLGYHSCGILCFFFHGHADSTMMITSRSDNTCRRTDHCRLINHYHSLAHPFQWSYFMGFGTVRWQSTSCLLKHLVVNSPKEMNTVYWSRRHDEPPT